MTWYKDWFRDENYGVVYAHRDEGEAEAMIDLIEREIGHDPARRVLDLGCGSGRHAISFARRGYSGVTGIDLSPTLLAEARAQAAALDLNIEFHRCDMREIPEGPFDLAVNLFTSFGYFETDEENAKVISNVATRLTQNGWFVIDFFNSQWLRSHLVSHDERVTSEGLHILQTRWIEDGRIEKRVLLRNALEAREYIESVRMFELKDFEAMFRSAGLAVRRTFGTYRGYPFSSEKSPRLILFASHDASQ